MTVQFQAENLSKKYGQRTLFDEVSFNLRDGDTLAVTGPNGSGKSTLLKICAGLLLSDTGGCLLFSDGQRVDCAGSRSVASSFPDMSWYLPLSAAENLSFFFSGDAAGFCRAQDLCRDFGLNYAFDAPLRSYSSGMLQRFSLSAAFALESPVMIFDEPASHLDESGAALFRELFTARRGSCISLIATHDRADADLCEKEIRLG
ncbi:MAG: ABC transporter ATP-binding protein [Spirochaetota bacterium]